MKFSLYINGRYFGKYHAESEVYEAVRTLGLYGQTEWHGNECHIKTEGDGMKRW